MNAVEMKNEIENEMKVPDLKKSPQVSIKKSIKIGGGVSYDTTIKCSEDMSKYLEDPSLKDTLDYMRMNHLKEGVFKGSKVQKLKGKEIYPFNPSPLHPRIGLGHIHTMEPMEKFVAENIGGAIICCMCGNVEEGFGNNPTVWKDIERRKCNVWLCGVFTEPCFEDLRCCSGCNNDIVVPLRMANAGGKQSGKERSIKNILKDLGIPEKMTVNVMTPDCSNDAIQAYYDLEGICFNETADQVSTHIQDVLILFDEARPLLNVRKRLGCKNHSNMVMLEEQWRSVEAEVKREDAEKEKALAREKKKLAEQEKKVEQQKKKVAELEEQRRQQLTADLSWFEDSKGSKKVVAGRVPKRPERVVKNGKGTFKKNDEAVAQWDFDYGKTHQHNGKPK